ncbi:mitochondrial carrier [Gigaspora margarita]|uniref:Mitochondrial carrier n=1 Tax=Gigaspora margarita TaxID=4874 RepID=A0A8H4AYF8_GIGMA|nr:mitochondrial carrier [Gigaspora margarita]
MEEANVMISRDREVVKAIKDIFSGTVGETSNAASTEIWTATFVFVKKGTLTPLVGIGACVSIQFAEVGYMRRYYGEKNKDPFFNESELYISGATAGLVNFVISGLQIRVTSKQPQTQFYSGPIDCIKKIYSSYGIRGIYKGQVITMIREFQGFGGYFFVYEYLLQRAMIEENKKREIKLQNVNFYCLMQLQDLECGYRFIQ